MAKVLVIGASRGIGLETVSLHQLGMHTVGDVAHADPRFLSAKLGSAGTTAQDLLVRSSPAPTESKGQHARLSGCNP